MSKKMVLKVSVMGDKDKTVVLKTAAKISGVKSLALDAEKGTLTVVGDVDVVEIVKELRKAGKAVDVISVGPEKEEKKDDKKDEKKDDKKKDEKKDDNKKDDNKKDGKKDEKKEEKKEECKIPPHYCTGCSHHGGGFGNYVVFEEPQPYGGCTII